MVSTKQAFSSLDMSKGPPIVLGDDSLTDILGKGRIDLDHGKFNNVLYVPGLSSNLLSMYQINHTRSPYKVTFSPNDVEITEISNGKFRKRSYSSHFEGIHVFPFSTLLKLLCSSDSCYNEASKLWHEIFGHINYKYISIFSEKIYGHRVTRDQVF